MTLHWAIISNELTQKLFCSTCLNQAVLDPNIPQHRTGRSDICKNGWYLLLQPLVR